MSSGRLAEVCAALCLATDLYTGFGYEYGISTTIVATRLGEELGLSRDELGVIYYSSLLSMLGCSSTPEVGGLLGDYVELGEAMAAAGVDVSDKRAMGPFVLRHVGSGEALGRRLTMVARLFTSGGRMAEGQVGHCEVAQRFATRLGLGDGVQGALVHVYERWDGKGSVGRAGEEIPVAMRVVHVAKHATANRAIGGVDAAVGVARERAGGALDPAIASLFVDRAAPICEPLEHESPWSTLLGLEPGEHIILDDDGIDAACEVAADAADQTSRWFHGHSRAVAELAAAAAASSGMTDDEVRDLRRAGWLHDLGILAVPNPVWDRAGPLGDRDLEQVRLHAYQCERIVTRVGFLQRAGEWAGRHHERLDGSGYHREAKGGEIPRGARVLAAADVYQALVSDRPHRPAFAAGAAADVLEAIAGAGRLDPSAVAGVLAASGQDRGKARPTSPAGLTQRECEVLVIAARGRSIKQIAAELGLRPKTVDTHLQNIYAKVGCSTRAAATLFAIENGITA